jgi:hypothetical protein
VPDPMKQQLPIKINKKIPTPTLPAFTDYFRGFENVAAVRAVFGDKTEEVLARLRLGFMSNKWAYMGIRDHDGNISVGTYHLRHSDKHVLYLDIVHELFHIGQWMKDKEWFTAEHERFMGRFELYWVSPIEVPAYKHAVAEAERLGMPREELIEYLKMGPPTKVWRQFIKDLKLEKEGSKKAFAAAKKALPVEINREPALRLLPFTDYFQGFEDTPGIKAIYGARSARALKDTKVEFVDSRWGGIFPSDDDGHLVINAGYYKKASPTALYLDVVLSLNLLKRFAEGRSSGRMRELADSRAVVASYKAMVKEARRLRVPDKEILEHMKLPRFIMGSTGYAKLVKTLGLKASAAA